MRNRPLPVLFRMTATGQADAARLPTPIWARSVIAGYGLAHYVLLTHRSDGRAYPSVVRLRGDYVAHTYLKRELSPFHPNKSVKCSPIPAPNTRMPRKAWSTHTKVKFEVFLYRRVNAHPATALSPTETHLPKIA